MHTNPTKFTAPGSNKHCDLESNDPSQAFTHLINLHQIPAKTGQSIGVSPQLSTANACLGPILNTKKISTCCNVLYKTRLSRAHAIYPSSIHLGYGVFGGGCVIHAGLLRLWRR